MKNFTFFLVLAMLCQCSELLAQNSSNKLLVGTDLITTGIQFKSKSDRLTGSLLSYGVQAQYVFKNNRSLYLRIGERMHGAIKITDMVEGTDLQERNSSGILNRKDGTWMQPKYGMFSVGLSLPNFKCECFHQYVTADVMVLQKKSNPLLDSELPQEFQNYVKNVFTGLSYNAIYKIAFDKTKFRLFFGPSVSFVPSLIRGEDTSSRIYAGVQMGAQYLLN